jgi:hypothetical protein
MSSREQTGAMSAAILLPSASVDKCDSWAPKGQNRIAQGFNPGLVAPVRFALKGQQIRRDRLRFVPTATRIYQPYSGATFRARSPRTVNPGLKPWAMMFNRFAVSP